MRANWRRFQYSSLKRPLNIFCNTLYWVSSVFTERAKWWLVTKFCIRKIYLQPLPDVNFIELNNFWSENCVKTQQQTYIIFLTLRFTWGIVQPWKPASGDVLSSGTLNSAMDSDLILIKSLIRIRPARKIGHINSLFHFIK